MPRNTRTNRRSGKGFAPEYARSLGLDEMPRGGRARGSDLEPWQLPLPDVMRGVIVCGQIKMRPCRQVRWGRAVTRTCAPLVAP